MLAVAVASAVSCPRCSLHTRRHVSRCCVDQPIYILSSSRVYVSWGRSSLIRRRKILDLRRIVFLGGYGHRLPMIRVNRGHRLGLLVGRRPFEISDNHVNELSSES